MDTTPSVAVPLFQLGVLMGIVILGHSFAVRRLPVDSVPGILLPRVLLCNKLRPWLSAAALAMAATGLFLMIG